MSERLKEVGDYKHGSIKRIKLTHFLTYRAVEFSPGPRLNMVIGPNGTGKSSILCAICLGLGGEPRLLGRADKVEAFIQNGETEAMIELEVKNEHGDDVVVTRSISSTESNHKSKNKTNKASLFTWNGDIVSGKKVRERASSIFQIQLDNLCTFLPQEKVGNFSGINSKDLLLETEKTLSDNQDLYNTHMKLIEMQKNLQGGDTQVDNLKDKVESLEAEVRQYKLGVDRMKEREKAEEQANLLEKKILWLKVDSLREKCVELKQKKDDARREVEALEDKLEPLEQANNHVRDLLEAATKEVSAFDKEIKTHERNMEKQKAKFEKHDDQIEETLAELASIDSTRAKYESEVQILREKVDTLQNTFDQQTPMEELEKDFARARQDQEALRSQYHEINSKLKDLQREQSSVNEELAMENRKMARLENEKEQRRKQIFGKFDNVKNAYCWIQNNRNAFRKEVIGPIACEISPNSNSAAACLEQHVPNSLLTSFVVQEKSDYDLLYQKVRVEQRIAINIILVDRISKDGSRIYSERKMNMLKEEHGVIGYLDETFEGPNIVMEALKSNSAIHKVLVGDDRTQDSIDDKGLGNILSESERNNDTLQSYCIFASKRGECFKYTSQISRYSGDSMLRVDNVPPARMLTKGASDDAKQKVSQALKAIQNRKDIIKPEIERTTREHEELLSQVQDSQQRAKDAKAQIQQIQRLVSKLNNYKRKLEEARAKLETDDEEEKKRLIGGLKQRVLVSLKAMSAHSVSYKQMMEATVKTSGAKLNKEVTTVQERISREKVQDAEREVQASRELFVKFKREFSEEKKHFKAVSAEANTKAPLLDEDRNDTVLKERLTIELAQFNTIGLAQAAFEEARSKMNDIHLDPNVVRLYEEKKAELEETRQTLDELTSRKEKGVSELERMKEPWFETLKKTISTVDKRFTKYMSELGCVGEISLKHDNDLNFSFEDYAVEIKVSFRANVAPSVLSSRVQSGGERSVSTIMYLMAMQDMMVSPFRCVDEINQGLDDRNERLVFKRIVENSTQPPGPEGPTDHCGQYWLVTPKLLPNLNDMEVAAMNVVCIFNGSYNLQNPQDWCTEKLVAIRKRRHENLRIDDDSNKRKVSRLEN